MPDTRAVIIPVDYAPVATCSPNFQHAGEVMFVMNSNDRHPRCPVCGRCAA
jgi:hypothetical protein